MDSFKIILSHAGKQHAYHVAKALSDLGSLEKFYTSSYIRSNAVQQIIEKLGNKFWSRRFLHGLEGARIESNWHFEFREFLYGKLYGQSQKTLNYVYERDEKFDKYIARKMNRMGGDSFWGFQGSSLLSLRAAKACGKLTICELATAHAPAAKRILEEEKKLHPEWADSIDNVIFPGQYYERLCEEPHNADVVIGASQFTLNTLRDDGISDKKLRYLPLGFEIDHIPFEENRKPKPGPIKILFAGRVTQRKGIKYLLEAIKQFDSKDVELHIIGHVHGSVDALKNYKNFTLHEPMNQYELFKKYQEFDLFVLPSVFEGFGLVIAEAMAAGLPVITTSHSIGPEIIRENENGYIVPIRDSFSIEKAIRKFSAKGFDAKQLMRKEARKSAVQFTWSAYTSRLSEFVKSLPHESK